MCGTHFVEFLQQLGLTPEKPIVLVYTGTDSTDFATAARAYWTLKSLGARAPWPTWLCDRERQVRISVQ